MTKSQKWPGTITSIVHRIGPLAISDIAVLIAVSSPHRKDAYRANEYAIERIKEIVPIWKKKYGKMVQLGKVINVGITKMPKGRVKIVKVLYFAEVKEILNMSNEYIDILEPKTVKEIRQLLNQYHPELMDKNSKLQSMKNLRKKTV